MDLHSMRAEYLDQRRESATSVLAFAGDKLTIRTRYSWTKGTSLRVRTVAIGDLGGDKRNA